MRRREEGEGEERREEEGGERRGEGKPAKNSWREGRGYRKRETAQRVREQGGQTAPLRVSQACLANAR